MTCALRSNAFFRLTDEKQRPARTRESDGMWVHDKAPGVARTAVANGNSASNANVASVNSKLVVSNLHYNVTPKDLQVC